MRIKTARVKELIREELVAAVEENKALGQDLYNCQPGSKEGKCKKNPFGGHTGVNGGDGGAAAPGGAVSLEEEIPGGLGSTMLTKDVLNDMGAASPKDAEADELNRTDIAKKTMTEQNYQEGTLKTCGSCKFGNIPVMPTMCKFKVNFAIKPDATCKDFAKR